MAGLNVNSILKLVSGGGVQALAKNAGADESQVSSLLCEAVPLLIGRMQGNAATESGAASLSKALSEHAGDDVSDVGSFLQNVDLADGKKILSHILGSDQTAATRALSKKSGLSTAQVTSILSSVAPLLLTLLGNNKKDDDGSSLGALLGGLLGSSSSSGLGATLLGNLLGSSSNASQSSASGSSGILGSLGSLAMNLFKDSSAAESKTESKKTGTSSKKTGTTAKKAGTTSKKTSTTSKKTSSTAAKKTTSSTAKKTTSTAKKTTASSTAAKKTTAAKKPTSTTTKKTTE